MAYTSANLYLLEMGVHRGPRRFAYFTDDSFATVFGSGYFSDAFKRGMKLGDIVDVYVGTLNTAVSTTLGASAAGGVSDFSAITGQARAQVSVANSTTFACTVVSSPQQVAPTSLSAFSVWGAAATTQPSATNQADIISTAAVSISATQWGYTTSTQATGIVSLLRAIRDALVASGNMKGSN